MGKRDSIENTFDLLFNSGFYNELFQSKSLEKYYESEILIENLTYRLGEILRDSSRLHFLLKKAAIISREVLKNRDRNIQNISDIECVFNFFLILKNRLESSNYKKDEEVKSGYAPLDFYSNLFNVLFNISDSNLIDLEKCYSKDMVTQLLPIFKRVLEPVKDEYFIYTSYDWREERTAIRFEKIENLKNIKSSYDCTVEYFFFDLNSTQHRSNSTTIMKDKISNEIPKELYISEDIAVNLKENFMYGKKQCTKKGKKFIAFNPDGKVIESQNITNFAKEHNLNAKGISACLNGHQKTHKGWSFKKK